MTRSIKGMEEIFYAYDGFILDLWGVVHDGVKPLPGAVEAMTLLKKANKKIHLLSNAPRRSVSVEKKMTEMGIARSLYDALLTSGEATHLAIKEKFQGKRCLHIGREDDRSVFEGVDVSFVDAPEEADYICATGLDMNGDSAENYTACLEKSAALKLPFYCANPDRVVHIEEKLIICAGTLADMYERLDGEVHWFGKPYREVYSRILKDMPKKVLAVGDSMLTDIAGATGAGIDSLLVTSGLHREEWGDGFLEKYPYKPTYVSPRFSW